jgi:DNA polymerase I-like protein with 3'-5' exonuclease and polymerase domains
MGRQVVVVDTEGSGLHVDDGARVSSIGCYWRTPDGEEHELMLPFGQGDSSMLVSESEDAGLDAWNELLDWLATCRLVMHNAKHDLLVLAAGSCSGHPGRDLTDAFLWDTMLANRLLEPLEPMGLESIAARWFNTTWKSGTKERAKSTTPKNRYDLIPWDEMQPYLHDDIYWTHRIYERQVELLESGEHPDVRGDVITRWMTTCRTLTRMEMRGLGYAADASRAVAEALQKEADRIGATLPFQPTPKKAIAWYKNKGYTCHIRDGKGEWKDSLNAEMRTKLRKQSAPHIEEYDRYVNLKHCATMWYGPYAERTGADGRLRTKYRQARVVSGRFSVERVNLQAIVHDYQLRGYGLPEGTPSVRDLIWEGRRPGCELYEIDVSQAEVRVGARYAGSEAMIAALLDGNDPHSITTRMVFGIDEDDPTWDHMRQIGKRLTLATVYDAGPATLRAQLKIFADIDVTMKQAKDYLAAFRVPFPEFKRACWSMQDFAYRYGYVPVALGERRYFKPYEDKHKAFNQQVQASVGAVMNHAMNLVEEAVPGRLLLQTHDSLLIETPHAADAVTVQTIMQDAFTETFGLPFHCDIKKWSPNPNGISYQPLTYGPNLGVQS